MKNALYYANLTSKAKLKEDITEPPIMKGYIVIGKGSMLGEEDAVSNSKMYTTTVKCHTVKATVHAIKLEDFLTLKNEDGSWKEIIEKALWKEKKKIEHPMHKLK